MVSQGDQVAEYSEMEDVEMNEHEQEAPQTEEVQPQPHLRADAPAGKPAEEEQEPQYLFNPTQSSAYESGRDAAARSAYQHRLRVSQDASALAVTLAAKAAAAKLEGADNADQLQAAADKAAEDATKALEDVAPKPEPL